MSRNSHLVWLILVLVCGSALAQNEIRWANDLNSAKKLAAQYNVPLLVHFYGNNCLPCQTLEARVYNQSSVVSTLNQYFIAVRINGSVDRSTAADFTVHSWPTDVFLSPDGQTLFQGVCKQDPNSYLEVLQNVVILNRDRFNLLAKNSPPPTNANSSTVKWQTQSPTGVNVGPLPANNQPAIVQGSTSTAHKATQDGLPQLNNGVTVGPQTPNRLVSGPTQLPAQQLPTAMVPPTANAPIKTQVVSSASLMVNNPYYPSSDESEDMVCGPDGVCYKVGPDGQPLNSPLAIPPATTLPATQAVVTNQPNQLNLPIPDAVQLSNPPRQTQPMFKPKSQLVSTTRVINGSQEPNLAPSLVGADLVGTENASPTNYAVPASVPNAMPTEPSATDTAPNATTANTTPAEAPGMEGYCPVTLSLTGVWVAGKQEYSIRHRGRTYWCSNREAIQQFLQAPDRFSPGLSGYDPFVFLQKGEFVDGKLENGCLRNPANGAIFLFSSTESKERFAVDAERNCQALTVLLQAASK